MVALPRTEDAPTGWQRALQGSAERPGSGNATAGRYRAKSRQVKPLPDFAMRLRLLLKIGWSLKDTFSL